MSAAAYWDHVIELAQEVREGSTGSGFDVLALIWCACSGSYWIGPRLASSMMAHTDNANAYFEAVGAVPRADNWPDLVRQVALYALIHDVIDRVTE